jgi:GNAT superfamily N-acetyltransferase
MLTIRELALLEEARLVRAIAEVAPEHVTLPPERGGGVWARSDPGAWANIAVGMGLAGPVPDETIDEMIAWFTSRRIEPRVELCPFADPTLISALADRGFVIRLFENVFFRELAPGDDPAGPGARPPHGVSIGILDPADPDAVRTLARTVASTFAADQDPGPAALALTESCLRHRRTFTVTASRGARLVGAGSIEIAGSAAALFGAGVVPDFRRRGIQQALIAARLRLAQERGVRLATISSRPGVATERNARRAGFQVAYTKPIVVRPGIGLVPNSD